MATNFKNIIGKEIGTQRVAVYTVPAATSTTVIGMNIANLTENMVSCNIEVGDEASNIGFLIKEMPIAPNSALKPIGKGEKVVLDAGNVLYVTADQTASLDVILSIVEIV
jgi:hypothetical protein|tara:strand:+ start:6905 stop:7234 length:330 start_codon:yes stop_codon:yes gene_type:complete